MRDSSDRGIQQATFAEVAAARELLNAHLPVTPMWTYPALNAATGATLYINHENVQPVGAFKVRGGLTLLAGMRAAHRSRGLITYSTGNHALSLAYAGAAFGASCTLVKPATASAEKVRAVRSLGATVVLDGADMVAAQLRAEKSARDEDVPCSRPALRPLMTHGGPGSCVQRPIRTAADGLAVGRGYEVPQQLMHRLADFLLVDEIQIAAAQRLLASHAHTLAEGPEPLRWRPCWPGPATSPESTSPWCAVAATPPPPRWPRCRPRPPHRPPPPDRRSTHYRRETER
jgi:threonine dehydratase